MPDVIVSFTGGNTIGLIVRGKMSPTHHPDKMAQHADAILADGSPLGFYGEGNGGASNGIGLGMDGIVYDYAALQQKRPYYVDQAQALANRVVSTVLLVTVTPDQARKFRESWGRMTVKPGSFNIVGGNCSSHASAAFIEATVLKDGIPGIDTPDNLYGQLVKKLPASSLRSLTGFIGFTPTAGGGYIMTVTPYEETGQVNRPNRGSSW